MALFKRRLIHKIRKREKTLQIVYERRHRQHANIPHTSPQKEKLKGAH